MFDSWLDLWAGDADHAVHSRTELKFGLRFADSCDRSVRSKLPISTDRLPSRRIKEQEKKKKNDTDSDTNDWKPRNLSIPDRSNRKCEHVCLGGIPLQITQIEMVPQKQGSCKVMHTRRLQNANRAVPHSRAHPWVQCTSLPPPTGHPPHRATDPVFGGSGTTIVPLSGLTRRFRSPLGFRPPTATSRVCLRVSASIMVDS